MKVSNLNLTEKRKKIKKNKLTIVKAVKVVTIMRAVKVVLKKKLINEKFKYKNYKINFIYKIFKTIKYVFKRLYSKKND